MNAKKIVTVILLVFVATSVGYMVVRDRSSQPAVRQDPPQSTSNPAEISPNPQIAVYYFHGDVRCPTCHKLENYAKEALDTYFAQDLADGKIQWKPTNVDTPGNEHFVRDYELVTKSVILSKTVNGQQVVWKNLDQIWQLVREKDKYLEYIRDSVTNFAAGGQQ
jgi:hypothetical protein